MKQIIILDFDDTLIVNEDLDFQSFRIISKKLKCYIPKKSEIASLRSKGYLASDIIDFIIKKSKNSITKIKFSENRIFFLESIESIKFLKIRPYAKKFIKKFKKNNFKIVIATLRKNENTLRFFLKKEGIISYIDQIYCNTNFTLDGRIPSNAYKIKKNSS